MPKKFNGYFFYLICEAMEEELEKPKKIIQNLNI